MRKPRRGERGVSQRLPELRHLGVNRNLSRLREHSTCPLQPLKHPQRARHVALPAPPVNQSGSCRLGFAADHAIKAAEPWNCPCPHTTNIRVSINFDPTSRSSLLELAGITWGQPPIACPERSRRGCPGRAPARQLWCGFRARRTTTDARRPTFPSTSPPPVHNHPPTHTQSQFSLFRSGR